jgi:hypothetical protein
MPRQVIRLFIVFAIFVILFLIARHFLTPKTFGEFGHYRGDALKDNKAREVNYIGSDACYDCHDSIASLKKSGFHKVLNCETCHGTGTKHVNDPKIVLNKPTEREFCGKCHNKNAAKSLNNIKQIDIKEHNIDNKCIDCHNPHEPWK